MEKKADHRIVHPLKVTIERSKAFMKTLFWEQSY